MSRSKKELTIICQLFYPELISTGQSMTELAEALSEQGLNITVICGPPTLTKQTEPVPQNITYKNIHIKRIWSTSFPKKRFLGKLINHITFSISAINYLLWSSSKSTLLTITNPPFLPIICALMNKIKKRPLIIKVADVYPETAIACKLIKKYSLTAIIWKQLNKFAYNNCDKVIVLGRCMKEVILPYLKEKNKKNCVFIPIWGDDNGIQASINKLSTTNQESHYISKWNLKNKFICLYSGNLGRFYDIKTMLDSAIQLKNNPEILFLFVGDGHQKKWAQNYSKTHGLSNCMFHDYVPREDLGKLFVTADIGLVSLLPGHEGLSVPSKTFGLLAAGVPILGLLPKKSEIYKLINEEKCGITIEPQNSTLLTETILTLMQNKKEIVTLKRNSLTAIKEKYALSITAKKYFELITEI